MVQRRDGGLAVFMCLMSLEAELLKGSDQAQMAQPSPERRPAWCQGSVHCHWRFLRLRSSQSDPPAPSSLNVQDDPSLVLSG